jgi:hypothetical protein
MGISFTFSDFFPATSLPHNHPTTIPQHLLLNTTSQPRTKSAIHSNSQVTSYIMQPSTISLTPSQIWRQAAQAYTDHDETVDVPCVTTISNAVVTAANAINQDRKILLITPRSREHQAAMRKLALESQLLNVCHYKAPPGRAACPPPATEEEKRIIRRIAREDSAHLEHDLRRMPCFTTPMHVADGSRALPQVYGCVFRLSRIDDVEGCPISIIDSTNSVYLSRHRSTCHDNR